MINLYINSGRWYLCHVPSTFATVNTHANVFFVFLPGGISKEWRHIVSANCHFDRQSLPCLGKFTGLSGKTWETPKIAHESHNDVRHMRGQCWCHLRSAGQTWAAKAPYRKPRRARLAGEKVAVVKLWSSNRLEAGET